MNWGLESHFVTNFFILLHQPLDHQFVTSASDAHRAKITANAVRERSTMASGCANQIQTARSELYNPFSMSLTRLLNNPLTVINVDSRHPALLDFYSLMAALHHETQLRVTIAEVSRARAERLAASVNVPVRTLTSLLLQQRPPSRRAFRDVDVLIVLEAQSLDLGRLQDLLAYVPLTTVIILIGDRHRLPPATGGDPFSTLLTSRFVSTLTVDTAPTDPDAHPMDRVRQQLVQGGSLEDLIPEVESLTEMASPPTHPGVASICASGETDIIPFVHKTLADLMDRHKTQSIQIVTPTRHGALGSHALAARAAIQVHPAKRTDSPIRIHNTGLVAGDVVICEKTLNDFRLVNGHSYTVTSVSSGTFSLDGQPEPIPVRLLPYFQFTHALTLQRYQVAGTPKEVVIIVLSDERSILMAREWLYTALTYARNHLYIIGSRRAYNECLSLALRSSRRCVLSFFLPAKSQ